MSERIPCAPAPATSSPSGRGTFHRARTRARTGVDSRARRAVLVSSLVVLASGCGGSATEEGATPGDEPVSSSAPAVSGAPPPDELAGDVPAAEAAAAAASANDPSALVAANALVDADRLAGRAAARFADTGLVPAYPQRDGDIARGRRALVEEPYVACGLPARIVRELVDGQDVLTLPDREAAAEGLPFAMNASTDANGVEIASSNCLACHGAPLFGELVIGLGNEFLDFTVNPSVAVERAGALVRGEGETAAWERYADRVQAIAPHMTMATVGTNPANNLTFALIAHREAETNAWSETPLLPLPTTEPPPVSVPPWWRMAKKHAMFNLGEGRGDHGRIMMAASMLCSDTIDELETIDAYAPDIRAYIASLEPPAWPFGLDAELAADGREVFEANCSACHGQYATDADGARDRASDRYPNRLVPIELVGTDPALVEQAHGDDGIAYNDWFNRSYYGRISTAAPGPGYVAPPLDGVWATGPFLHNGSVPSVRALLDSGTRPARWAHVATDASDPASYDEDDLGWRFAADDPANPAADRDADADDANSLADVAPNRIYDTSRPGHANTGHRFGDHLTDTARSAVIEYLKTL